MQTRYPWYVLMELTSSAASLSETMEAVLARGMEEGLVEDAVLASSIEHRRSFWNLRDFVTHSQKPEGGSIKHDISVPVAAVPAFIEEANAAVVKLIASCRPIDRILLAAEYSPIIVLVENHDSKIVSRLLKTLLSQFSAAKMRQSRHMALRVSWL